MVGEEAHAVVGPQVSLPRTPRAVADRTPVGRTKGEVLGGWRTTSTRTTRSTKPSRPDGRCQSSERAPSLDAQAAPVGRRSAACLRLPPAAKAHWKARV